MAVSYEPIKHVYRRGTSGMPLVIRAPEAATQTFKTGTPLALSSGLAQASAFGGSELVYGVSAEAGSNLSVANTAEQGTNEGAPQNQTSAVTIPVGSRFKDGKCGVYLADENSVFSAMLKDGQVFTQGLVSATRYELAKDSTSGFWYIDNTSNGTNDEHCVNVTAVDPSSPNSATLGARVYFVFAPAARFGG